MRSLVFLVPALLIACHHNEPPRSPEPAAGTVEPLDAAAAQAIVLHP